MTTPKRNEAVAITRYDPVNGYDSTMRSCGGLVENAFGVAVRYSDHVAVVDALQGEVSRLREALDEAAVALSAAGYALAEFEGFEKRTEDAMQKAYAASRKAHDANGYTNLEPPTDGQ